MPSVSSKEPYQDKSTASAACLKTLQYGLAMLTDSEEGTAVFAQVDWVGNTIQGKVGNVRLLITTCCMC